VPLKYQVPSTVVATDPDATLFVELDGSATLATEHGAGVPSSNDRVRALPGQDGVGPGVDENTEAGASAVRNQSLAVFGANSLEWPFVLPVVPLRDAY